MHIVSLSCCTVCREEKCHRLVSVGSFQVRGRWLCSSSLPSQSPYKAFMKSGILGYIRAAKTVPCKLYLSTSLHDQNEKWPGAICVIYGKITLSCYVLPLLFIPSWWCCVTDSDTDWYCHFYEATINKMLYQDLLGWRKNSNCPPDTRSIPSSITLLLGAFLGFFIPGEAVPSIHYTSELNSLSSTHKTPTSCFNETEE